MSTSAIVDKADAVVAVITPTKNRLKLLCEAMDSVRRQTFGVWEHIIVDDGSDDGTKEEVARRAADDPRIRYIQRTGDRAGANICRNIGIRSSSAGLVTFLDSDDLIRPQFLDRRVQFMGRNTDLDFAVFRAGVFKTSIDDLGRTYHFQDPGDDLLRFLSLECVWEISGPVWRRGFLEKIGGFDESLLSMQDLELHVRAISARGKYVCVPETDHDIRSREAGTSTSGRHFADPLYIRAAEGTPAKLLASVNSGGLLTWSRQRALMGLAFGVAESWARSGQVGNAVRAWSRGSEQQGTPWYLYLQGCLVLFALRIDQVEGGFFSRLAIKWKGWVRFRQEPALLEARTDVASPASDDASVGPDLRT